MSEDEWTQAYIKEFGAPPPEVPLIDDETPRPGIRPPCASRTVDDAGDEQGEHLPARGLCSSSMAGSAGVYSDVDGCSGRKRRFVCGGA